MAAIDTSVYNMLGRGVKTVADYAAEDAARQQNVLAVQQGQQNLLTGRMKLDEYQRGIADQAAEREAYKGFGADTAANTNRLYSAGLGKQAGAYAKDVAARAKDAAAAQKDLTQTAGYALDQKVKAHDFHVQQLGGVASPQDAIAWAQQGVQSGVFTPEQYQVGVQRIQQAAMNPQAFAQWKQQALQGGATATEQLRMQAQAAQQAEVGRHNLSTERNAAGQLEVSRGQLGVSQGQLGVARGNLGLRSAELEQARSAPKGVITQTDQGPVLVDPRTGASRPLTMNGQPLAGKGAGPGKLTEDQGKATGWLVQADNAFKNMNEAMSRTPSAARPGFPDAVAAIPSAGLGGALANTMRGADRQQFLQGASSLGEALLRAATGAGVNKDEAKQKIDELTPVFGEKPETTRQKMAAIPLYIESLKVRAGPGAAQLPGIVSRSTGGATGDFGKQSSAVDDALKKYGSR